MPISVYPRENFNWDMIGERQVVELQVQLLKYTYHIVHMHTHEHMCVHMHRHTLNHSLL